LYQNGLITKSVLDAAARLATETGLSQGADKVAAEEAQKRRDSEFMKLTQQLGNAQYGAAVGQANSQFKFGKEQAKNQLTKLITQLGQQNAGAAVDLGSDYAQSGLSTSPGMYDVGLDTLAERRLLGEQQGREGFAATLAQLGQQRKAAAAQAAAARYAEQLQAITEYNAAKYAGMGA
jgi:hypothetical protein